MKLRLTAALLLAAAPWAAAQIVVGQTAGFTGPAAAGAKEASDGAKLVLDAVNAAGGVHGQKIELVTMDDRHDPKQAADNARQLATGRNALALLLTQGAAPTQAVLPVLKEHKLPLVAPASGATALHEPVEPWVFNLRAPVRKETEKAVLHLVSTGFNRIAVAHVDDPHGSDAAIGALRGFDQARLRAAFVLRFKGDRPDFTPIVNGVVKLDIQALVLIGPGKAVADATRALRAKGSRATVVTVSDNANGGFLRDMADQGRGSLVTQVMPNERHLGTPLVKEAHTLAAARGHAELTPAMLEGVAGAKLLVEGLKRAGPNPTRQRLRDALESMGRIDLGGLELGYGAGDHTGLDYADVAIIGPDGRFRR